MSKHERVYQKSAVIAFSRTNDPYGELSNFNPKFHIIVPTADGDVQMDSSETFYQADKFRDHPEIQRGVVNAAWDHKNPPRGGKDYATDRSREPFKTEDWAQGRSIQSMRYVIRLKYAQHRDVIKPLLEKSGDQVLVEYSTRDSFWGAKPDGPGQLRGNNFLGRLWMELREEIRKDPDLYRFTVPAYDTKLFGSPLTQWVRPAAVLNAHVVGTEVEGAVYIGRAKKGEFSKWGNPVPVSDETPRGQALLKYLDHLRENPQLVEAARTELAGKDLICWCAPRACHGEVLRHVSLGNPVPETWDIDRKPVKTEEPEAQTGFDF